MNVKNQHFVPRLYLRNFSNDITQRKLINLFHVDKAFFTTKAQIKHEASSNFLYGTDGKMEKALSNLEGIFAKSIKRVIDGYYPKQNDETVGDLIAFIVSTDLRNIKYVDVYKEMISEYVNESAPDKLEDLNKLYSEINSAHASAGMLRYLNEVRNNCTDLNVKIIKNKTTRPFITSDFPIIKYNQLLEQNTSMTGITGYGMLGLQIFVPLSSLIGIILYDGTMYNIGGKSIVVEAVSKNDIDNLNILQAVNCCEKIYGDKSFHEDYAIRLKGLANEFPKPHKLIPKQMTIDGTAVTKRYTTSVRTRLELSFVRFAELVKRIDFTKRNFNRPLTEMLARKRQNDGMH